MSASFVEVLMDHIMEGVMIPKVQIERAVGPILGMFLADVLTETFREDPELSGPIAMICPEFPLKKAGNMQSTNLDWLMYNSERSQLLFIELKTSDTSIDAEQNTIYRSRQDTVRNAGGSFLIEDLKMIVGASPESGKYRYILEKKASPLKAQIAACHDARIIYLVPASIVHKVQGHADRVLNFAMLSNTITGPFAEEWSIVRGHLCALDESSKRSRNGQTDPAPERHLAANFVDRTNFHSIVELCKQRGDAVMVGFSGGVVALKKSDLASLENRMYKWDNAAGGIGYKLPGNWIRGSIFYGIINESLRDA